VYEVFCLFSMIFLVIIKFTKVCFSNLININFIKKKVNTCIALVSVWVVQTIFKRRVWSRTTTKPWLTRKCWNLFDGCLNGACCQQTSCLVSVAFFLSSFLSHPWFLCTNLKFFKAAIQFIFQLDMISVF
jgi:hypothetical protein